MDGKVYILVVNFSLIYDLGDTYVRKIAPTSSRTGLVYVESKN